MKRWTIPVLLLVSASAPSVMAQKCAALDEFIESVNAASAADTKKIRVENFLACVRRQGAPLIEETGPAGMGRAVFLYAGPASKVVLSGDMNRWTQDAPFVRLPDTNLFYISRNFELDARLDYKFVKDDKEWILDPLNPRRSTSGFGTNSYFAMPDYVPPPEFSLMASIPRGAIEEFTFASDILKNSRIVKVYLPPGYAAANERYRVLYVHDGADYLNLAKINEIIDVMISEKEIPPIVLVMVPPVDREHEYWTNAEFARAFATELVPSIDKRYRARPDADSRAMLGASLGGLIAVYIAGRYPELFGNCAGQSSAFFPDSDLERMWKLAHGETRFHLDVGTYEENHQQRDLLNGNRRLRDFLRARGYRVNYREVHEGHSWGSWQARIPEVLCFFWGNKNDQGSNFKQ